MAPVLALLASSMVALRVVLAQTLGIEEPQGVVRRVVVAEDTRGPHAILAVQAAAVELDGVARRAARMESVPVNMSVTLGSSVVSVASVACAKRGPVTMTQLEMSTVSELVVTFEQALEAARIVDTQARAVKGDEALVILEPALGDLGAMRPPLTVVGHDINAVGGLGVDGPFQGRSSPNSSTTQLPSGSLTPMTRV